MTQKNIMDLGIKTYLRTFAASKDSDQIAESSHGTLYEVVQNVLSLIGFLSFIPGIF